VREEGEEVEEDMEDYEADEGDDDYADNYFDNGEGDEDFGDDDGGLFGFFPDLQQNEERNERLTARSFSSQAERILSDSLVWSDIIQFFLIP
jgi:hypothetical protein